MRTIHVFSAAQDKSVSGPSSVIDKEADAIPIPLLRRVRLFNGLGVGDLAVLARTAEHLEFHPGTYIFKSDRCDTVYLLASGGVAITQTSDQGRPRIVRWVGPAEIFGAMGQLRDQLRPATAHALARSRALSWNRDTMGKLMKAYPLLALNALSDLEDQLWEIQRHYQSNAEFPPHRRSRWSVGELSGGQAPHQRPPMQAPRKER